MSKTITVTGSFDMTIEVTDEAPVDIFERAAEPGFPYTLRDGGPLTRGDVIRHLAHNAATNGVTDISELDGWADFPRGAVCLRVQVFDADEESVSEGSTT